MSGRRSTAAGARRARALLLAAAAGAAALLGAVVAAVPAATPAGALIPAHPIVGMAATADGRGYWVVGADGGLYTFGAARFHGSAGALDLSHPVVGMAALPDGRGYWLVAADGGVFTYGAARFYGSAGGLDLQEPVVAMAATPDGRGYWMVSASGRLFWFGDARDDGSLRGDLRSPIVGMAATADGRGYWMVAADGGVFSFGDARFYGSAASRALRRPVVGMAATPSGRGYWLVAADGGVFSFGDARFYGSAGGLVLRRPVVGMAATPSGRGYWLVAADGAMFSFGDAAFLGSVPGLAPPGPPRIDVFGDSQAAEAGPDLTYLGDRAGATVMVHAYGGVAICNYLDDMAADAASWQPTVAVLDFSGNNLTPCMHGDPLDSAPYFAQYRADAETAISIFEDVGTRVILVGSPLDESPVLSANVAALDNLYASVAAGRPGVTYVDAGASVLDHGAFTWTLPCLPFEPCTGPAGTNVVRSPDGVHFCPTGQTTMEGNFEVCDVYSSGALRMAMAMLAPALDPPTVAHRSTAHGRRPAGRRRDRADARERDARAS